MSDTDETNREPRILLAALAGLLTGICCYGYPAVRLFLPCFLVLAVLVGCTGWLRALRSRKGVLAVAALVVGGLATFGPLAWQHLSDTDATGIARRSKATWAWGPDATFGEKASILLSRYPAHFLSLIHI